MLNTVLKVANLLTTYNSLLRSLFLEQLFLYSTLV